jgi:hypothetical protein
LKEGIKEESDIPDKNLGFKPAASDTEVGFAAEFT